MALVMTKCAITKTHCHDRTVIQCHSKWQQVRLYLIAHDVDIFYCLGQSFKQIEIRHNAHAVFSS